MSNDSDILIYFLISSLNPPKKIFEIINQANQNAYVQAQELLNNYLNLKDDEEMKSKRIKIPIDDSHAFHIYITKEELIYISYSNTIYFSTELNFDLFEEINEYLKTDVNRKINEEKSFLIEDEKDEIKDIINYYVEEYSFLDSLNTIQTENESENTEIKKNENDKKVELNLKKKENPKESLLKNTIIINGNKPVASNKMSIRQSLKMKHLSKTVKLDKKNIKNKVKFKLENKNKQKESTNHLINGKKYGIIDLTGNKGNNNSKISIIVILAIIVAIEVIGTILIINFYDYSN